MSLKLMYITNKPNVALIAQKYGVDRIWVDLETLGKEERQKNQDTVKSRHSVNDIKIISPLLKEADMLVRINPWNINSIDEIDQVVEAGADLIMLPMWKSVEEVGEFINAVAKRAKTVLLLETKEAVGCLDDILKLSGVDEIHIGLNDLHLSYGLTFMFELLSDGTVEGICNEIKKAGIPYGFGGIAKIGEGLLSSERIILEHYRLGSTRAILSRSFCNADKIESPNEIDKIFGSNMKALRDFEKFAETADKQTLNNNRLQIKRLVAEIVRTMKERGNNG